jgi:TolB-like protein
MQYKGVRQPLPTIARELGVDGILEGSLERSGNRVHMTAQLILCSDGYRTFGRKAMTVT